MNEHLKKHIEGICLNNPKVLHCCPRCGKYRMGPSGTNALSRVVDVEICSQCGTDEALIDWLGTEADLENDIRNWRCLFTDFGEDIETDEEGL